LAAEDAVDCPSCGQDLRGEVLLLDSDAGGPDGATVVTAGDGRGGRATRALVIAGVAVVALIAVLAAVKATSGGESASPTTAAPTTRPSTTTTRRPSTTTTTLASAPVPLLPVPTGFQLVSTGSLGFQLTAFDTGANSQVTAPEINGAFALLARAGGVVGLGSIRPVFLPLPAGDPPVVTPLGQRAAIAIPSARTDRVWVVTYPVNGQTSAQELDMQGNAISPASDLPDDASPVGAVQAGLVVEASGGIFVVPADGSPPRRVAVGRPFSAAGDHILLNDCGTDLHCRLRSLNVTTGRQTDVSAEGILFQPFLGQSATVDGTRVAVTGEVDGVSRLVVVDTVGGTATVVPQGQFHPDDAGPVWSPDGTYLFWRVGTSDIRAWHVGDADSALLPLALGSIRAFTVTGGAPPA
jgi:hypothetical protein